MIIGAQREIDELYRLAGIDRFAVVADASEAGSLERSERFPRPLATFRFALCRGPLPPVITTHCRTRVRASGGAPEPALKKKTSPRAPRAGQDHVERSDAPEIHRRRSFYTEPDRQCEPA